MVDYHPFYLHLTLIMLKRNIVKNLEDALADSPVILLNGARQTGKSTLVQWMTSNGYDLEYLTMDDATVFEAVQKDSTAFLKGLSKSVVLDEIQRVPELFIPIKASVDRERRPGRFILTGSANVFMLPKLSESLAGRMEIQTLWPLSQGEILGRKETFIDFIFSDQAFKLTLPKLDKNSLFEKILLGGFPEVISRSTANRRMAWFNSYLTTILQRDVRDISNIQGLTSLPRLLSLLSARAGTLVNFAEISTNMGIPQTTLKRYMTLFETTFMVHMIMPWSENLSKRLIKTPKLYLCDTGLSFYLQGLTIDKLHQNPMVAGQLVENFVALEILKQQTWNQTQTKLYHFRTAAGQEVDFLLEDMQGNIVGIEVKSSETVQGKDFKTLEMLQNELGNRFHKGIVLYAGKDLVAFGPKLWAVPIQTLWEIY